MKTSTYIKTMFFLSLAGFLFSGYLSAIKLFEHTCAFNSPCPYFLGYPSCWYGFSMFTIILIASISNWYKSEYLNRATKVISIVSGLGILFSGYFTIPEIEKFMTYLNTGAKLNLPTCAFGLIFYIIIFSLSLQYLKQKHPSV